MFISLDREQAAAIRQKLLETLAGDFDRSVRNKVSDAVAEVARQYTENSRFPAIYQTYRIGLFPWFSRLT